MLIDSHCHLNYDYTPKTADDLIREATEAGVEAFVTIGTDLPTLLDDPVDRPIDLDVGPVLELIRADHGR